MDKFLKELQALVESPKDDQEILAYNQCPLFGSDLDVLSGTCCIRSRIIDFYFSLLGDSFSCARAHNLLLVPPSITSMMANSPDFERLYVIVNDLVLRERELVIFAVSDEDDINMAGGWPHWSLLVYDRKKNMFVHHDSCSGVNELHALNLYGSIKDFLNCSTLVEGKTPQQKHFYDCGIYMMAIARTICEFCDLGLNKESELWFSYLEERVNDAMVANMRNELLSSIQLFLMTTPDFAEI